MSNCGDAAVMEGDNIKIIDIQKFEACTPCRELIPRDVILDNLVDDEFLFTVESNGALAPERIVTEAVKILKKRLAALVTKIDADDIHDEISDFDLPDVDEGKLYSIGSAVDEEEEAGAE